jgi:hypothetical protein
MGSKWMVDCHGSGGEGQQKNMQKCMEDANFAAFIQRQGSIAAAVQNFIIQMGYHISDRGGGMGDWHVGVPFDNLSEAVVYLDLMTTVFARAIGNNILCFSLKTWSNSCWRKP